MASASAYNVVKIDEYTLKEVIKFFQQRSRKASLLTELDEDRAVQSYEIKQRSILCKNLLRSENM